MIRHLVWCVALLALVGCSSPDVELTEEEVERTLRGMDGYAEADVTCPDPVDDVDELDCTAQAHTQTIQLTAALVENRIELDVAAIVFDRAELEADVGQQVADVTGTAIRASCSDGDKVVIGIGSALTCRVEDENGTTGEAGVGVDASNNPTVVEVVADPT